MKPFYMYFFLLIFSVGNAQTNPVITKFLQNTTETGNYYVQGNSTAISNGILVNCQLVEYSTNYVYVHATGVPAYPTGIFTGDGNPSNATDQAAIYKLPLNPVQNTGTLTSTPFGNVGIFINGVSQFDYKDGVAWNNNTQALCGGPGNPPCPGGPGTTQAWNRDAIPAEKLGFDCSKGHPAMGNYHHHQNPSAFKLDLNVISTICDLYDADGLYALNASEHSPLIGFAYDGFPIYGAYAYANADGTGGITRMKSGYQLRTNTTRTNGPAVSTTYFNGYFKEDYEFITHASDDYLDVHNGRFCVTPEYPNGIYCYFATVDENWNSTFPYMVGLTYYGTVTGGSVTSVSENTTVYTSNLAVEDIALQASNITILPNPASDIIAVQMANLVTEDIKVELYDMTGKLLKSTQINKGASIAYFDVQTLYNGTYLVKITQNNSSITEKVMVKKK